jgi:hypothetical protein
MQLASLGTAPEAAATQPPQAQFTPHPHLTGVSAGAVAALLAVPMVVVLLVVGMRVRRRGQRVA